MNLTSYPSGIRFFYIVIINFSLLFSQSSFADRCENLGIGVGFSTDQIDITTMEVDKTLFSPFTVEFSGTCNGYYDPNKPRDRGGFVTAFTGDSSSFDVFAPSPGKPSSRISLVANSGFVGLLAFQTGNVGQVPVQGGQAQPFVLREKWPGETIIHVTDVLGGSWGANIYSSYNFFDTHVERENSVRTWITGSPTLKLIYRPTCTISVKDVDFGTLTVDEILAENISRQANVDVSCNDILLNYDIKISSNFNKGFTDKGIISSNNSTIQYQLDWGDLSGSGLDSFSNDRINLDATYSLEINSKPAGNRFSIPIKVKPIANIAPGIDIKPGEANSDIVIQMTFK